MSASYMKKTVMLLWFGNSKHSIAETILVAYWFDAFCVRPTSPIFTVSQNCDIMIQ